jgi:hypothetical protein
MKKAIFTSTAVLSCALLGIGFVAAPSAIAEKTETVKVLKTQVSQNQRRRMLSTSLSGQIEYGLPITAIKDDVNIPSVSPYNYDFATEQPFYNGY